MAWEFAEAGYLRRWILGEGPDLNTAEQQDTPWVIAKHFRAEELIEAYALPGGLPERRDEMLFCIGLQLEWFLDPNTPDSDTMSEQARAADFNRLADFVQAHSHHFLDRWQDLGFGGEYEAIVIPFIQRRLERRDAES